MFYPRAQSIKMWCVERDTRYWRQTYWRWTIGGRHIGGGHIGGGHIGGGHIGGGHIGGGHIGGGHIGGGHIGGRVAYKLIIIPLKKNKRTRTTKWTVRGDAVKHIIENYVALKQLWSECLTNQLDPDVKGKIIGVQAPRITVSAAACHEDNG